MVRRIKYCYGCQSRFVAVANKPICPLCEEALLPEEAVVPSPTTTPPTTTTTTIDEVRRVAATTATPANDIGIPTIKRIKVTPQSLGPAPAPGTPTSRARKTATCSKSTSSSSPSWPITTVDLTVECDEQQQQQQQQEEDRGGGDDSSDENSISLAGSEGGDDFHCTQINEDDQEDDQEEEDIEVRSSFTRIIGSNDSIDHHHPRQIILPHGAQNHEDAARGGEGARYYCPETAETRQNQDDQQNLAMLKHQPLVTEKRQKQQEGSSAVAINNRNVDICLICGTDLSKLKRRIDHMKRCSKKHNIIARDTKFNGDFEEFVPVFQQQQLQEKSTTTTTKSNTNPYTKECDWHGEASIDLQLADQATTTTTTEPSSSSLSSSKAKKSTTGKQLRLSSFFEAPVRSLNNVLMAGARRVSKLEELKKQQKNNNMTTTAPTGRKRSRGGGGTFQRRNYSKKECPMYKKIPGTDFVCDGFHYAKSNLTQNYFLTHFHSDHYGGITKSWNHGIIYCSVPTATLVAQQLGVDKKYIHPLPMLSPIVIASRGKPVTVTLIDANHCPGAVMFLFEIANNRTILHVGDFRWDREFMLKQPPLKPFMSGQKVLDKLFLDTTYCDPKYSLPSQKTTIDAIIMKFQNEVGLSKSSSSNTLHLFGAYTIGKEKMYLRVAEHFKMKVYVDSARYRVLSALNWPKERMKLLTKNKEEACIWVVPLGHINMKKMPEYLPLANTKPFSRRYERVVGYRPTGWSLGGKPSSSLVSTRSNGNVVVYSVPYSEHSSFPELVDSLESLQPKEIIPTVSVRSSEHQVEILLKSLKQKQTTLQFST